MFGKKKLAIGLASVAALTTLAGAGIASAHGGGEGRGGEYAESVRERAAEILGIDPASLQEAIRTARAEADREMLVNRLNAAVAAEAITVDQRDEILAWVDSRPDAVGDIARGPHIGVLPLHAMGIEARLDALVEAGTLTPNQADEITAWLDAAPEALSSIAPERRHFGGHKGRWFHGPRHFGLPWLGESEASGPGTNTATASTSATHA